MVKYYDANKATIPRLIHITLIPNWIANILPSAVRARSMALSYTGSMDVGYPR